MNTRQLGKTGLKVSIVGLGTAEIGLRETDQAAAERALHGALDAGITLIDTAACYGDSEVKIGKAISSRRDEYVLVTKCGHRVEGVEATEWTAEAVRHDLERSLRRLKTDRVDVLLLHSCSPRQLDDEDMLGALREAKESGRTRLIGYSGDADGAQKAVGMGLFDVLETSVSICDQQCLERYLPLAEEGGMGVIAKRPLANGCWRDITQYNEFYSQYAKPYAERLKKMGLTPEAVGFDGSFPALALRFAAYSRAVSGVIVGSTNLEHIQDDLAAGERGPLAEETYARIRRLWKAHADGSWQGLV